MYEVGSYKPTSLRTDSSAAVDSLVNVNVKKKSGVNNTTSAYAPSGICGACAIVRVNKLAITRAAATSTANPININNACDSNPVAIIGARIGLDALATS